MDCGTICTRMTAAIRYRRSEAATAVTAVVVGVAALCGVGFAEDAPKPLVWAAWSTVLEMELGEAVVVEHPDGHLRVVRGFSEPQGHVVEETVSGDVTITSALVHPVDEPECLCQTYVLSRQRWIVLCMGMWDRGRGAFHEHRRLDYPLQRAERGRALEPQFLLTAQGCRVSWFSPFVSTWDELPPVSRTIAAVAARELAVWPERARLALARHLAGHVTPGGRLRNLLSRLLAVEPREDSVGDATIRVVSAPEAPGTRQFAPGELPRWLDDVLAAPLD